MMDNKLDMFTLEKQKGNTVRKKNRMSNAPPSIEHFHSDPHWHQVFFPIRQDSIALESCSTIVVVTNTSEKEQKQTYRTYDIFYSFITQISKKLFLLARFSLIDP